MKLFKRHKKMVPGELINTWQQEVLSTIGINASTEPEQIKEACRKVLLSTSRFYENILRTEAGMKPIKF